MTKTKKNVLCYKRIWKKYIMNKNLWVIKSYKIIDIRHMIVGFRIKFNWGLFILNMLSSTINKDTVPLKRLPILIIFETLVVVVAILIIASSSLIVRNIYEKKNRTRADFMFMLLSISDIGVGVLSMAALGVFGPFWKNLYNYYQQGSRSLLTMTLFFYDFPYIFSNVLTSIIAIDRLFIIASQSSYKYIITEKRLKIIVLLVLTISIGYCCVTAYYSLPERCCSINRILGGGFLAVFVMSMILVISAYIRILSIVRKGSKSMLACNHRNSKSDRRLSATIFYILVCQVACVVPYLILFSLHICSVSLRFDTIGPWLVMLRNCQCFCNAFILLRNQKRNTRKCENFPLGENLNKN